MLIVVFQSFPNIFKGPPMQKNLPLRLFLTVIAMSGVFALSACSTPGTQTASSTAKADPDEQEYVTGSRFPVKDKSQSNVSTSSTLQSSTAR
jgi:hypothetical protein